MGRFGRIGLFVLGTAAALFAIILIGVNLYVQSQGTQARIQQELSQRLGTPLRIERVSVTPWGGLTLNGITIPQISPAAPSRFLEAKSFHLHLRFLSLLSRRLVIKEVSLFAPNVVWPQDANGKWRLPGPREEEQPRVPPVVGLPTNSPPTPQTAMATSVAPAASTPLPGGKTYKTAGFVPEVRRANVTGGNFKFLDRSGNPVAIFEDVNFHSTIRDGVNLRGSARITKVSLRDRFFLKELKSPLRYDRSGLELEKISARAANGNVTGHFIMEPQSPDSPFSVDVKFRNVYADQILAEAGGPKGTLTGKLDGSFEAAGKIADPNALTGAGEIFLRDGQLRQYNLLVALGQIFQIEELNQLHLEQAQLKYRIGPALVTIDELILHSPNIRLSATGTVTFDGKLQMDARLAINEKIRAQLFKPIRENFQPTNENGYSAVDFQVTGTLERPRTNLMERMVGRELRDFVSGFLGGNKSERSKKKKPVEPTPTPTEASTPLASPGVETASPAATPPVSPP